MGEDQDLTQRDCDPVLEAHDLRKSGPGALSRALLTEGSERGGGVSRERRPSTRGAPHGSASRPPDQASARVRRAKQEFALAPAARAAGPMRVARAEEAPWDAPPSRDSCGTVRWLDVSPVSPVSPVCSSSSAAQGGRTILGAHEERGRRFRLPLSTGPLRDQRLSTGT